MLGSNASPLLRSLLEGLHPLLHLLLRGFPAVLRLEQLHELSQDVVTSSPRLHPTRRHVVHLLPLSSSSSRHPHRIPPPPRRCQTKQKRAAPSWRPRRRRARNRQERGSRGLGSATGTMVALSKAVSSLPRTPGSTLSFSTRSGPARMLSGLDAVVRAFSLDPRRGTRRTPTG